MARDLIPPPSPAGRPEPDAPRLVELPPEPVAEAQSTGGGHVGPSRYRHRFGFLLGALAGIVVAAVALLAVVLTTGDGTGEGYAKNWSAWQPRSSDPETGAQEIAAHVQGGYHLSDGKQLVLVTGGPLEVQDVPLGVALRPPDGSIRVQNGTGILYTLNGLGPKGAIASGKPSEGRHLLLRREALELALYSFRYLRDVDMVVALLPPTRPKPGAGAAKGGGQTQALFYRPGDLEPQLQVPLAYTVPGRPPAPEGLVGDEARRIDSLTRSNLFLYSFQQAQDAKAYLVLDRAS